MCRSDASGTSVSCGREFDGGTSNLLIGALNPLTATKATIVASIVKKHSLRNDILLSPPVLLDANAWRPEWNYSPWAAGRVCGNLGRRDGSGAWGDAVTLGYVPRTCGAPR